MPTTKSAFRGVFTALATPFNADGSIDEGAYRALLADQIAAGVSGVVPAGTTGESPTLSTEEKRRLIELCLETTAGTDLKVIAGTGSNDTRGTVELSRWASDAGAHGVLVVTPYYNKPSDAGLLAHFRAAADAVKCELVLYNVPGRTGVSLSARVIAELARHERIRAIKEATGNAAFASEVLDAAPWITVLSGDDLTWLPLLAVGAEGVISVASNLVPRAMLELQRRADAGDLEGARELHRRWYPVFRDLFVEANPGPVKHGLERRGFGSARVRAPLAELTAESRATLERTLARAGVAPGTPA